MKFKYFLRGLGTGIIFASIISLVVFQNSDSRNISDREVIERAKDLGMVEKQESVKDMFATEQTSAQDNASAKSTDKEKSTTQDDASEKSSETTTAKEKDTTEEKKTTEAASASTTEKEAATEKNTTEKNTTEKELDGKEGKTVTITVRGGSSSYVVCQELQKLGVIENATDFDDYLIKNGYANRISVGTHTLKIGMTYEEIAVAISDPS